MGPGGRFVLARTFITQDTAGVPGTGETGDGFGDVIGNALYGMPGGPGTSNWLGLLRHLDGRTN